MVKLNSLFIKKLKAIEVDNFIFYIDLNTINEEISSTYELQPIQLKKALYVIYKSLDEILIDNYSFKKINEQEGLVINNTYQFYDKGDYHSIVNAYKQIEDNIDFLLLNRKELINNTGDYSEFKTYVKEEIKLLISSYNLETSLNHKGHIL